MPHYFIDTFDGLACHDDEGYDLPDSNAARVLAHCALTEMMRDDAVAARSPQVRATVRDEHGKQIMQMSLAIVVEVAA